MREDKLFKKVVREQKEKNEQLLQEGKLKYFDDPNGKERIRLEAIGKTFDEIMEGDIVHVGKDTENGLFQLGFKHKVHKNNLGYFVIVNNRKLYFEPVFKEPKITTKKKTMFEIDLRQLEAEGKAKFVEVGYLKKVLIFKDRTIDTLKVDDNVWSRPLDYTQGKITVRHTVRENSKGLYIRFLKGLYYLQSNEWVDYEPRINRRKTITVDVKGKLMEISFKDRTVGSIKPDEFVWANPVDCPGKVQRYIVKKNARGLFIKIGRMKYYFQLGKWGSEVEKLQPKKLTEKEIEKNCRILTDEGKVMHCVVKGIKFRLEFRDTAMNKIKAGEFVWSRPVPYTDGSRTSRHVVYENEKGLYIKIRRRAFYFQRNELAWKPPEIKQKKKEEQEARLMQEGLLKYIEAKDGYIVKVLSDKKFEELKEGDRVRTQTIKGDKSSRTCLTKLMKSEKGLWYNWNKGNIAKRIYVYIFKT